MNKIAANIHKGIGWATSWWEEMIQNKLYFSEDAVHYPSINKYLHKYVRKDSIFIDAGCGEGRFLNLASAIGATTLGFDTNPHLLNKQKKIIQADITKIPIKSNSADVALCSMVLMLVDDIDAALKELSRVIIPDGRLILSLLHPCFEEWGFSPSFPFNSGEEYLSPIIKKWPFYMANGTVNVINYYHRSLSSYLNIISKYFKIDECEEPHCFKDKLSPNNPIAKVEYLVFSLINQRG